MTSELTTIPEAKRGRKSPKASHKMQLVAATEQAWDLRKASETLTIRNISSIDITFLVRKAYNAMLQIAQSEIARTGDEEQVTFSCSLKKFEELVGHSTPNSRDNLKKVLRQVAQYQVEYDYHGRQNGSKKKETTWGVASLISEVLIIEETSTVHFSFPPNLKKQLLHPAVYNSMDLRMQNKVSCHSALVLYEIVSRYSTSPGAVTFKNHWTEWSVMLSGAPGPHGTFRDFHKMLKRAMDQVEEHEKSFSIELHITKLDRKYDVMWFAISAKEQGQLDLETSSEMVSKDVQAVLGSMGFDHEIPEIVVKYDEEYILAQADWATRRSKRKDVTPVLNMKQYFKKALEENYAETPIRGDVSLSTTKRSTAMPKKIASPEPSKKSKLDALKNKWKTAKIAEIKSGFESLSEEEQKAKLLLVEPVIEGTITWKQYKLKGMKAASVAATVYEKLFEMTVPEPSSEELLVFAVENVASLN